MNQAGFARALLDPEFAVPEGIIDPNGKPAPKRFSVYRNNVASGLIKALEASFPVIRKLVGDEFFAAMAVVFARAHPPRSRLLAQYGDAFPDFLSRFPPVSHLGYLADVARLEHQSAKVITQQTCPPCRIGRWPHCQKRNCRMQDCICRRRCG